MKLPYIIIRTADLERLEREAAGRRFWQAMSEQVDQLMDTALDVIACQRETLEQYEEAMQAMTAERNTAVQAVKQKLNGMYGLTAAEATTKPAEPAEQTAPTCETCKYYETLGWQAPCGYCEDFCEYKARAGEAHETN